jgi:hypothetical protein
MPTCLHDPTSNMIILKPTSFQSPLNNANPPHANSSTTNRHARSSTGPSTPSASDTLYRAPAPSLSNASTTAILPSLRNPIHVLRRPLFLPWHVVTEHGNLDAQLPAAQVDSEYEIAVAEFK